MIGVEAHHNDQAISYVNQMNVPIRLIYWDYWYND
jgi:hypothetical protein